MWSGESLMRFKGMQDGSETTDKASEDKSMSLFVVTVGSFHDFLKGCEFSVVRVCQEML